MDGVILYSLERNGCLNGVYTNDDPSMRNIICNEIARRRPNTGTDHISGTYDCVFFEPSDKPSMILTITNISTTAYSFVWGDLATPSFIGVGYVMNDRQIVVRYND